MLGSWCGRVMIFRKKKQEKGFSLIELSIAMTIVGLVVAGMLQTYKIYRHTKADNENMARLTTISIALGEYVARNSRYPCPARTDLPQGHADFGKSSCPVAGNPAVGACSSGICRLRGADDEFDADVNPDNVLSGSVPFVELNIPFRETLDGWGRRFTYVMSEKLQTSGDLIAKRAISMRVQIERRDPDTDIVETYNIPETTSGPDGLAGTADDEPVVEDILVISHGEDGKGAYSPGGGLYRACPTNAAWTGVSENPAPNRVSDAENCDLDGVYTDNGGKGYLNSTISSFNDDIILRDIWEETNFWTYESASAESNVYNRYANRVGVGVPVPGQDLDVFGNIKAEKAHSRIICNVSGDDCFDPDKIGGDGMRCNNGLVLGFQNGQAVCAQFDLRAAGILPSNCAEGYLAVGISPTMEVICALP